LHCRQRRRVRQRAEGIQVILHECSNTPGRKKVVAEHRGGVIHTQAPPAPQRTHACSTHSRQVGMVVAECCSTGRSRYIGKAGSHPHGTQP
jgi:hypothetical protein